MSVNGPTRMRMQDVVEQLIAAQARSTGERSSVKLGRSARGVVQPEVLVRVGEHGVDTVQEAHEVAVAIFNALCELYPLGAEVDS